MAPPRNNKEAKEAEEKKLPVIKDDYGYIVNPYVPKFISKTPWYAEETQRTEGASESGRTLSDLRKDKSISDSNYRSYDEKHDRWNKYDESEWKPQEPKAEASSSADKDKINVVDPYSRTCSRNLRIREDTAKYLDKSNAIIAETYDPKSRSIGIKETIKGESRSNHFAWDEGRKVVSPSALSGSDANSSSPKTNPALFKKNDRRYNY